MKINVLITAASRRVSLVRNFRRALNGTGGRVITIDYDIYSPALFFAHSHYKVPLVNDPEYLETIECIAKKEEINVIIPSIDQELLLWAENRKRFEDRGITVSISDPESVAVCNDKWQTYLFFKQNGLPFPETYLPENLTYKMDYPLFIKPRDGRGSVDAYTVKNKKELDFFVDYVPNPVIQEFVSGREFTVDAYFSKDCRLVRQISRHRLVIRSGVSDRGRTFIDEKLVELLKTIGEKLPLRGAVNIQGKISKDSITFFEINPRFSGGIQLSTAAGCNFADLILAEARGENLEEDLYNYKDHLLMTSYEDSLFIDNRRNVYFFYNQDQNKDILPEKNKAKL